MIATDSYDSLAASIERRVRTDIAVPDADEPITTSIDRIMRQEACAAELRIAYLRPVVFMPLLTLTVLNVVRVDAPLGAALAGATMGFVLAWLAASLALVVALRRNWYERWLPRVVPVVDAATILVGFFLARSVGPWWGAPPAALVGYVAALCTLLSLAGALRLSGWAARASTALALLVFLIAAVTARLDPFPALGIAVTLAGVGILSAGVTSLIRRVVSDEVARTTLTRMFKDAEVMIDAREQVLKVVSHDLRNPLHTISMSASLLLEVPMPPESQATHLQRIKRAGERMNRLIQDLLDVAKLESGRVGIEVHLVEAGPLVQETHEMLEPLAIEHGIELAYEIVEPIPLVTADAGRVVQVLSNLVGNALKFTPRGGRVAMRVDGVPGGARFAISDTGPGIPENQLSRLFARFWQGDPSDRRGIGLGLTIAKGIVDAHDGRIWVDSEVGKGTTFYFTLGTTLPRDSLTLRERRRSEIMRSGAHDLVG